MKGRFSTLQERHMTFYGSYGWTGEVELIYSSPRSSQIFSVHR